MGRVTSKNIYTKLFLIGLLSGCLLLISPVSAQDWTQVQNDSANTGKYSEPIDARTQDFGVFLGSNVIINGENGVFFSGDQSVRSYNIETGEENWVIERQRSFDRTPIIHNGNVYFTEVKNITILGGADSTLNSVNSSGDMRWQREFNHPIGSPPAIMNGTLYVGIGSSIRAINTETGHTKWSTHTDKIAGGTVPAGNDIYAVSIPIKGAIQSMTGGETSSKLSGSVYSINLEGGVNWRSSGSAPTGYPAVSEDHTYVSAVDETVRALSRKNGSQVWSVSVNGEPRTPVYSDGSLYVSTRNSTMYAFNSSTGNTRWTEEFNSSTHPPAVSDDRLYVVERRGIVHGFSRNGRELWNSSVPGTVQSPPTVSGNTVYVVSGETFYSVNEGSVDTRENFGRGNQSNDTDSSEEEIGGGNQGQDGQERQDAVVIGERNETEGGDNSSTEGGGSDNNYSPVSIIIPLIVAIVFIFSLGTYLYVKTDSE